MKVMRKIINIDEELCTGCGQCIPSCAEGALEIVDGKAKVIKEIFCDGLGACLGECPTGALTLIEREADEFDEKAVEKHLEQKETITAEPKKTLACGCPSTQLRQFNSKVSEKNSPCHTRESELSHWPIQIRLVPPDAPFLKQADLLVLADCVAVALPGLQDLIKGKRVMMGCPKFDEVDGYIEKFSRIFKLNDIKSVTIAIMEVPCCSGMRHIVKKAMDIAGKQIPVKEMVIDVRGNPY